MPSMRMRCVDLPASSSVNVSPSAMPTTVPTHSTACAATGSSRQSANRSQRRPGSGNEVCIHRNARNAPCQRWAGKRRANAAFPAAGRLPCARAPLRRFDCMKGNRMSSRWIALVAAAVLLAGCDTLSKGPYAEAQVIGGEGSPRLGPRHLSPARRRHVHRRRDRILGSAGERGGEEQRRENLHPRGYQGPAARSAVRHPHSREARLHRKLRGRRRALQPGEQAARAPRHAGAPCWRSAEHVFQRRGRRGLHVTSDSLTVAPGPYSVVNRAIVIHESPDDYRTQPAGNSGARIACGVIKAATSRADSSRQAASRSAPDRRCRR